MGLQVIGFLIFNQFLNSKITYNREYTLKKKVILIFLVTFVIFAYWLNSKITEKENNLFDTFLLPRKGYSEYDAKLFIKEFKAHNSYQTLSKNEKQFIDTKLKTLLNPNYTRYYELLNKQYIEDQDSTQSTNIEESAENTAKTNSGIHYLITFFLFVFMFSENSNGFIIKAWAFICLAFFYIEANLISNSSIETMFEEWFPFLVKFTLFQKFELVRAFFHFFLQFTVGLARVLFEADKENTKEDLTKVQKEIEDSKNTCFQKISNWSLANNLLNQLDLDKNKKKEEKTSIWKNIGYIILFLVILSIFGGSSNK